MNTLKKSIALLLIIIITAALLSACISLEDIRPEYSVTEPSRDTSKSEKSNTEPSDEISEPSANESSEEQSEEPSEESSEESNNNSEEPSEESSETSVDESNEESKEESSEPQFEEYDYKDFKVSGFELAEIKELLNSLDDIIGDVSVNISIYYEDLETGRSFSYDADRRYCAGSVIKAPYAMYLMKSDIDLEQKLTLSSKQVMEGSGVIDSGDVGKSFTIEKLIEYSVEKSDNTAYRMLYDCFGFDEFNYYTAELGVDTGCNTSKSLGYLGNLSANEAAVLFKDIYNSTADSERAARLMEYLNDATYSYLLESGIKNHDVAHKYGYMSGTYKVLHDVGIVFADEPYVISIMTNYNPSNGNGRSTFKSISALINSFHDAIHS